MNYEVAHEIINAWVSLSPRYGFEWALQKLKSGRAVRRADWPESRWLYLVRGGWFHVSREPLMTHLGRDTPVRYGSHIDLHDDLACQPWAPTSDDLMAEDWILAKTGGGA